MVKDNNNIIMEYEWDSNSMCIVFKKYIFWPQNLSENDWTSLSLGYIWDWSQTIVGFLSVNSKSFLVRQNVSNIHWIRTLNPLLIFKGLRRSHISYQYCQHLRNLNTCVLHWNTSSMQLCWTNYRSATVHTELP